MPYLLRAIYNNVKWDKTLFPSWLTQGDLPACIIKDLKADDNALSLWEITDNKSNLLDIVAAFASLSLHRQDDFDYALIDTKHLDELTFPISEEPAKTAYRDMNHCHRNLCNLSLNGVVRFAHLLSTYGEFDRIGWKRISAKLKQANARGQLDLAKMKPDLVKHLG